MKEVLIEIVKRISRKAMLLTMAMILVYMIVITPNVIHALIAISVISGLSILGVSLQFWLDFKDKDKKT